MGTEEILKAKQSGVPTHQKVPESKLATRLTGLAWIAGKMEGKDHHAIARKQTGYVKRTPDEGSSSSLGKKQDSKTSEDQMSSPSNRKVNRKEEERNAKSIELYLKQEKELFLQSQQEPKLLLLGSADSGKSTLLKQLKIIHGNGFTNEERDAVKISIVNSLLSACQTLINLSNDSNLKQKFNRLMLLDTSSECTMLIPPEIIETINELWNMSEIQEVYDNQSVMPETTS
ncbi:Guanine nucleotide-binding protein subunit alpha-14 [Globomyces sp. JEL0801]|nr:Guanine nucleotide-binding protein subunit alpha-14 [Globomyces sp. JEL0801]